MHKYTYYLFSYYGGKTRLIFEIITLMPRTSTILIDVYGGSGAITLNRPPIFHTCILNDKDPGMYTIHKIMADQTQNEEFINRLTDISLYTKQFFDEALKNQANNWENMSEMDIAIQKYFLVSNSFNSTQASWVDKNITQDSLKKLRWRLLSLIVKYRGLQITNLDGIDLIKQYKNNKNALLVLDPPYLLSTRKCKAYTVEMETSEHRELLAEIKDAKAKIILFGYHSELYDQLLSSSNWESFVLKRVAKNAQVSQKGTPKEQVEEWVWANFQTSEAAQFYIIGLREKRQRQREQERAQKEEREKQKAIMIS